MENIKDLGRGQYRPLGELIELLRVRQFKDAQPRDKELGEEVVTILLMTHSHGAYTRVMTIKMEYKGQTAVVFYSQNLKMLTTISS